MPTANGGWVPVLDGSGWERYSTEDGVMHRQFKGVDDDEIARQAEWLRSETSRGRNPDGGNMAFHMPQWLLSELTRRHDLDAKTATEQKRWWKVWQRTPTGQRYTVRGI